ncbi:hypothetical protein C0J52_22453 [Blattella germanica]|nr:hypothetical protein C0J52_22453 [Blattella germanica]
MKVVLSGAEGLDLGQASVTNEHRKQRGAHLHSAGNCNSDKDLQSKMKTGSYFSRQRKLSDIDKKRKPLLSVGMATEAAREVLGFASDHYFQLSRLLVILETSRGLPAFRKDPIPSSYVFFGGLMLYLDLLETSVVKEDISFTKIQVDRFLIIEFKPNSFHADYQAGSDETPRCCSSQRENAVVPLSCETILEYEFYYSYSKGMRERILCLKSSQKKHSTGTCKQIGNTWISVSPFDAIKVEALEKKPRSTATEQVFVEMLPKSTTDAVQRYGVDTRVYEAEAEADDPEVVPEVVVEISGLRIEVEPEHEYDHLSNFLPGSNLSRLSLHFSWHVSGAELQMACHQNVKEGYDTERDGVVRQELDEHHHLELMSASPSDWDNDEQAILGVLS